MSALVDLLTRLVALDSVSSRSNAPVVELIAGALEPLGFHLTRHAWRDAAGEEKVNLVALSRLGEPPALALVGHTDTVPFDPAWPEALRLTGHDGRLFGRGACDTKGFVACALEAAARTDLAALARPLALVFTAEEEIGCVGAKRLAAARAVSPRFAIVGEPTSLRPVRAHKGYSLAEIRLTGQEGHSSIPAAGRSSIFAAADLIGRLERFGASLLADSAPGFVPPYTTLNIGQIHGGGAPNVIAGGCSFLLEWRTIPSRPLLHVLEEAKRLGAEIELERNVHVEVELLRSDTGLETPADSELVRFLVEQTGSPATTVAYATEGPELVALGAETVVFGPGDIAEAHRTGEFVPQAELERCAEVLEAAIARFCGA